MSLGNTTNSPLSNKYLLLDRFPYFLALSSVYQFLEYLEEKEIALESLVCVIFISGVKCFLQHYISCLITDYFNSGWSRSIHENKKISISLWQTVSHKAVSNIVRPYDTIYSYAISNNLRRYFWIFSHHPTTGTLLYTLSHTHSPHWW